MPQISEKQIKEMDSALDSLMNFRLRLTKISDTNPRPVNSKSQKVQSNKGKNNIKKSKYHPPVIIKEHYLSLWFWLIVVL